MACSGEMEEAIKEALGTQQLKSTSQGGGGCISQGQVYLTDSGKIFLKFNSKEMARRMFEGELAGLRALGATGAVRVPTPHLVVDQPDGGAVLVMEYLDMQGLHSHAPTLGRQLARLHLHNIEAVKKQGTEESKVGQTEPSCVTQFGFPVTTCCGFIPQDNTWCSDWQTLITRKLDEQLSLIEKEYGDREARQLWPVLQRNIPQFFTDLQIEPSLLHGDLWSGNAAQTSDGPVIIDPAAFYGHHEYDLSIAAMFGGFSRGFWDAYFREIPKAPGWNKRHKLYQLFHKLNHWNHFGGGYRSSSLQMMRELSRWLHLKTVTGP